METNRLDIELKRIHNIFSFLWQNYNFHTMYFTRDYGIYNRGFVVGLGNGICKLVFEKETDSQAESIALNVGTKYSVFAPPDFSYISKDGWYALTGLIYWSSGIQCERSDNLDEDLKNVSEYLRLHIDKLLNLFRYPDEFEKKLEQLRNQHKNDQITVDKIKAERARLQSLGQDSSLEAAINSLRGGKK